MSADADELLIEEQRKTIAALLEACREVMRTSSYDEKWPEVMDNLAAAIAKAEGKP